MAEDCLSSIYEKKIARYVEEFFITYPHLLKQLNSVSVEVEYDYRLMNYRLLILVDRKWRITYILEKQVLCDEVCTSLLGGLVFDALDHFFRTSADYIPAKSELKKSPRFRSEWVGEYSKGVSDS